MCSSHHSVGIALQRYRIYTSLGTHQGFNFKLFPATTTLTRDFLCPEIEQLGTYANFCERIYHMYQLMIGEVQFPSREVKKNPFNF